MPFYSKVFLALVFVSSAFALPTPQLAGEGQALDAIFTGTDNAVGYGVENAEENTAALITSLKGANPKLPATRRQLAGEGQAFDAIFTGTDNAVGYGVENAEENTAATITSLKAGLKLPGARRQLDKISKGLQAISEATGTGSATSGTTDYLNTADGALTGGAANAGQLVGGMEESLLEGAGKAVPKARRQLDKISNGLQTVSEALDTGDSTTTTTGALDTVDGSLTGGAANIGQQIGNTEESTLEGLGKAVPKL